MTPNPQPSSSDKAPLWIIAFSLLTIAICLVALVLRSFTGREPEAAVAAVESPVTENPFRDRPVRVINPARAASAPSVSRGPSPDGLVIESPTQTVVQTSQTIVITPPMRGLARGAKTESDSAAASGRGLTGTVVGQVTLQEQPPPEKSFAVPGELDCDQWRESPPTTHNYVVGTNRGLANALVRLIPAPAPGPVGLEPTNARTATLSFTNCDLQPYMIAVSPEDYLVIRNTSPMKHVLEIYLREGLASFTTIPLEAATEFARPAEQVLAVSDAHIFPVRCALHEWERASIAWSTEPRFAITDLRGRFAISNVPPYAYRVELFHPAALGMSSLTRNVTVYSGSMQSVVFRVYPKR